MGQHLYSFYKKRSTTLGLLFSSLGPRMVQTLTGVHFGRGSIGLVLL